MEPIKTSINMHDITEQTIGIKRLVAALKVILKPGPVPLSTVLGEALYFLDTCGSESMSLRVNA